MFKYVIPERIDALRNQEIRFTQAAALNDPFELNAYFEAIIGEAKIVDHLVQNPTDIGPYLAEAYERLDAETKAKLPLEVFLAFVRQLLATPEAQRQVWESLGGFLRLLQGFTPDLRQQLAERFRTEIGILSLSEVCDCAPMWAHYAANHTGFVIEFDESDEFFNRRRGPEDEFFHLRKVNYCIPMPVADLTEMDGQRILASKSPEWSYENEWRMLIPVKFATRVVERQPDSVYLVTFPSSAVKSVILGAHATADLETALRELLNTADYSHVALRRARLDDRLMQVVVEPVT